MKFDRVITVKIKERRNFNIRLELGGDDKNTFSPGETIRGR
jgi:hypothetical protein